MSHRKFIFRGGSTELILPVTPSSYRVECGTNVEVINIHELGDAIVTGYGTLATIKISCLLPACDYPFSGDSDAESYVEQFKKWIAKKKKLRFVIGNTGVNMQVIVQSINYGEQDGTNDIYADLVLREYRQLKAVTVKKSAASKPRTVMIKTASTREQQYTIKYGDTLCGVCRKYYGDGAYSTAIKLAQQNAIPNANIIRVGQVIRIPHPLT